MAKQQPENNTETQGTAETDAPAQPQHVPRPWVIGPLRRLPPRYQQPKWLIGGAVAAVLLIFVGGDYISKAAASPDPELTPAAVATPTPEPTSIPREEYRLPRQYAFVHFVNEMSSCYEQNGQPDTLEAVEADIMADVPGAVGMLMRLYADNICEEAEPWNQIPGRAGWMLRSSGMHEHLPALPDPEEQK